MVHDVPTDQRHEDGAAEHGTDLDAFLSVVLGTAQVFPSSDERRWCVPVGEFADGQVTVEGFLARAVTDLRTEAIESAGPSEPA